MCKSRALELVKINLVIGLTGLLSAGTSALGTEDKGIETLLDAKRASNSIGNNAPTTKNLQDRMFALAGEHPIRSATELNKQLNLHPNSADLLLQLGEAYFLEGDADNAFENFHKALASDPKCAQAHIGLSRVYFGLGRNAKGFEELQKAVKEGNKDVASSALWESAFMHQNLGQPELALSDYDKAFERGLSGKLKVSTALLERAEAYLKLHKRELALADLDESIKLEPNELLARKDRANVLRELNRNKEALEDLNACLEICKKYSPNWLGKILAQRANLYRIMGRNDLAAKDEQAMKSSQADDYSIMPFQSR